MNHRPKALSLAAGLCTVSLLTGCETIDEGWVDKHRIDPLTAERWLQKSPEQYLVVDARSAKAYESGHIPGAVRMDLPDIDPLDPDPKYGRYKAVVVYGEDPSYGKANALAKRFGQADVEVYLIDGGLKMWRDRGLPVTPAPTSIAPPKK